MPKIKIGDIFEILTAKGFAYLHFVDRRSDITELIRVLPGLFEEVPDDLEELANNKEKYFVFFPVGAAYHRKLIRKAGASLTNRYSVPPFMRTDWQIPGEPPVWHIVDTQTWKRDVVKELSDEQLSLSPWGIWNDTLLKERLEDGWELDDWK